jgi:hypothetical protein
MATALLYNTTDLVELVAALNTAVASASGADRTTLNRILTAIGNPTALPVAQVAWRQGDPDTRQITLSYAGVSVANVHALWNKYRNLSPALIPFIKDVITSGKDGV